MLMKILKSSQLPQIVKLAGMYLEATKNRCIVLRISCQI
jgi:hypothetical protein